MAARPQGGGLAEGKQKCTTAVMSEGATIFLDNQSHLRTYSRKVSKLQKNLKISEPSFQRIFQCIIIFKWFGKERLLLRSRALKNIEDQWGGVFLATHGKPAGMAIAYVQIPDNVQSFNYNLPVNNDCEIKYILMIYVRLGMYFQIAA